MAELAKPVASAAKKATPKKATPGSATPKKAAPKTVTPTKSTLAAGAARAGGERARRRGTPLIVAPDSSIEPPVKAPVRATHRPAPVVTSGPSRKARKSAGVRTERPRRADFAKKAAGRPLHAVHSPVADTPEQSPDPDHSPGRPAAATVTPAVDELLRAALAALRAAAPAVGIEPGDVEAAVARTLAFVRRRVEGDYTVDDFGFDQDFTDNVALPLLRPLYQRWFRVEVRGIDNIPTSGGALVVANHSGTVAVDSLMTQVAVHDETPGSRHLRMLGADLVFDTPFLGTFARRSGSTLAANADAERLLSNGELVGVWPEGFKGVGKPYTERYKLQRFGRGGFVSAALKTGVPIIPCSIVGAEEIYPIVGNLKTLGRLFGLPYFPVTANMALGPLCAVPLPSKWIIEFGTPLETASLGPAAAEDPMLVFDLTDQVRETIQQSLYALLMQRRSVFF